MHKKLKRICLSACLLVTATAQAQTAGTCQYDSISLQFQGSPVQQAQCLLRPVARWGKVATAPAKLPATLEALIGQPSDINRIQLKTYLAASGLDESAVGGKLDNKVTARYFVIHDTSAPWLENRSFPPDNSPELNNLAPYKKTDPAAHVFVSRTGQTFLGHDFNVPWRATKLETKVIGEPSRGQFLHIELLQPRRRDPAGGPKNDAQAPTPGFTSIQYERLALLYTAASVRAERWLVPALHAPIDEGLNDAHDDPQNFLLADFSAAVEQLRLALTTKDQSPSSTSK